MLPVYYGALLGSVRRRLAATKSAKATVLVIMHQEITEEVDC